MPKKAPIINKIPKFYTKTDYGPAPTPVPALFSSLFGRKSECSVCEFERRKCAGSSFKIYQAALLP